RQHFAIFRWAAVVAAAALPLTFAHGVVPAPVFVSSVISAVLLFVSLMLQWRTRRDAWSWLGVVGVGICSAVLSDARYPGWPFTFFFQWLCLVLIFAGSPLVFVRRYMLHLARLDDTNVT